MRERVKGEDSLTELEDKVREEVGKVPDPETGMTFAEMQMITTRRRQSRICSNQSLLPDSLQISK